MENDTISGKKICGKRIKTVRTGKLDTKHHSISQEKLAIDLYVDNCKITRDTITDIESGRRDVFDIELLWFAKILNVSPYYLMDADDAENDETIPQEFRSAQSAIEDKRLKNRKNICGIWIKAKRYEKRTGRRPGLTQQQLAEMMTQQGIKMTYYTILYIERGQRRVSATELKCFAKVLNVDVRYLLEGSTKKLPNIYSFESYAAEDEVDKDDDKD